LALVFAAACESLVDRREVSRVTSPDGRTDAVLQAADGGATTSIAYQLYLAPKGTQKLPSDEFSVFIADHVEDLKVDWIEPKMLEISYREARIFKFTNVGHGSYSVADQTGAGNLDQPTSYLIELRLHPTSNRSLNERDRHY
jgi:hypothetical protein